MKKIVSILLVISICLITTVSYAAADISAVTGNKGWITNGGVGKEVGEVRKNVIGVIQAVGVAIAIVMLVSIGIRYMVAAPDEKADLKKRLVPYLVGAILIFGSSGIIGIVYRFMTSYAFVKK